MVAKKKASKKKTSRSKAVAKAKSTEVTDWKAELAKLAEQESDRKTTIGSGGDAIKLAKGKFKFQGEDLGEELEVVVVSFAKRKAYYDRPFDEDNPCPPACFAVSGDGKNMAPVEDAPAPQSEACEGCEWNEFGTDNRGRGKACRESYLLGVVAASDLENIGTEEPDIAYLSVPPTSIQAWDSYMVKRNKVLNLPAMAFVTRISFDDEVDYQKIFFDEAGRTPENAFGALFNVKSVVDEVLLTPPDFSQYEPPKGRKTTKKKTKKKTTRRSKF